MKTHAISVLLLFLASLSSHAATLLVNGGFESMTAGLPNSWTYAQGDGPATVQSATASPFTNIYPAGSVSVLLTDGASSIITPDFIQSFATQSGGILYAAWDFRLNSMTGSAWGVQIDDTITALTHFRIDNSGNFVVENSSGATTTIMALTSNTWYQVQLALDLTTKTLSGSITTEGGVTTAIASQSWRVTTGGSTFSRVIILDSPTAGTAGNILFDNFTVDRTAFAPAVPEPSRLLLLGLAGFCVVMRRRR